MKQGTALGLGAGKWAHATMSCTKQLLDSRFILKDIPEVALVIGVLEDLLAWLLPLEGPELSNKAPSQPTSRS